MPVASARALANAGRDGVDRRFAHALCTERAKGIAGLCTVDFGTRHVGESGNTVVTKRRVDDPPLRIENHPFAQSPSQSLGDAAFHLAAQLHWIDDRHRIDRLDALEDANFARDRDERRCESLAR